MISSSFVVLLAALSVLNFRLTTAFERRFSASPKHPSLKRGNNDCAPRLEEHELVFVEDASELFVATVKIEPTHPTLILEDLDHHIRTVLCSKEELHIEFHDKLKAAEAASLWELHEFFILVTHEHGCQVGNEHTAWNVSLPKLRGDTIVSFSATLTNLKQATRHMNVELGEHLAYKADLRRLRVRQATATLTTEVSPSFSFASPTATGTGLSLTQDIGFSEINKVLVPPESALASLVPSPPDFSLSCVNCTLEGAIKLTAGAFGVDPNNMDVLDFFTDGFLDFEATNIGAHMEFALQFLPGFQAGINLGARLLPIKLGGINIAGMLQFGPVLDLVFPLGVTLNTPVTFNTGFTITAPPSLLIHLNVSEPLSSQATGFSQASLDAIPFKADAENLSFDFFIGFRPEFRLDASSGSSESVRIEGGIGLYLELPMLTANVAPLNTPTDSCKPKSSESLYLMSPNLVFGSSGATLDIGASIESVPYDRHGSYSFFNATPSPLATQCLRWDAGTKTLTDTDAQKSQSNSSGRVTGDKWNALFIALLTWFFTIAMTN